MRSGNPSAPNFLDKTSPTFFQLHTVIDNQFKELRQQGVGSESKHAEIISKEEEDMLWKSGVMGTHSPQALFNAVFFFNGKNFCLRGGQEHRGLKLSQFKKEDDKYIYTENASKNRQGGLAQMRLENKCVPIHANPEVRERCHVYLLDLYISKLPPEARERDFFYARPLYDIPKDPSKPCYCAAPISRNTLASCSKNVPKCRNSWQENKPLFVCHRCIRAL